MAVLKKTLVLVALCAACYAEEEFLLTPDMPGGISTADQNSEAYKEAIAFAMEEINKVPSLGTAKLTLQEVINAREQVVAGIMHHLTLRVVPTGCEKNVAITDTCEALAEEAGFRCFLKVWSKPWEKFIGIVDEIDCKPF